MHVPAATEFCSDLCYIYLLLRTESDSDVPIIQLAQSNSDFYTLNGSSISDESFCLASVISWCAISSARLT